MKLHKYLSAALLAGAVSFSANAALADDDMITDFQARDAQIADSMQNEWLQAQAESFARDGSFDVALTYCSTTNIFDEGELVASYSVCDDIPNADVG